EARAGWKKLPADAVNYKIHNLFIPVPQAAKWTTLPDWKARQQELVKELREKVFRWFPREKVPFTARIGPDKTAGWAERYADCKEVFFDTEPGLQIRGRLLKPRQLTERTPLLLYVKRPIDSVYFLDLDEF